MEKKSREDYEVKDFLTDESFTNYHFHLNIGDQLSWEEWLINHREKRAVVKQARDLIQTLSLTISNKEFSGELEKMKDAINTKSSHSLFALLNPRNNPSINRKSKRKLFYLVPILLIIIVSSYLLLPVLQNSTEQLIETVNNTNAPLFFTLSDSTVVNLFAHSSLKYPSHFHKDKRNVYLQGEAQFNVKRNLHAPFKVHTENIIATVLGTVFNFKNSGDSAIIIELIQGKLNIEMVDNKTKTSESIILHPYEKATYVRHNQHFYKNQPEQFSISFHKNNFEEIAAIIKSISGTTVINNSNKKAWRFTGEFKNITVKDVIESICVVKNLTAEVQGDTIYIK